MTGCSVPAEWCVPREEIEMVMNTLLLLAVIGGSIVIPGRCEAEDVHGSGFGLGGSARRIAVLQPLHDYDCVENVVCSFKIDDHLYQVIDLQCDRKIDYVLRDDGLVLMVLPPLELERPSTRPGREGDATDEFNPEADILWDALIDDGRPSPFHLIDPHRWLQEQGLLELHEGDLLAQVIHIDEYSIDAWTADVTVMSSSRLMLPEINPFDTSYQWYSSRDVESGIECWSIRIRGDLESVSRWLAEAGFFEVHVAMDGIDCMCKLVTDRNIIEVHMGSNLVATLSLD